MTTKPDQPEAFARLHPAIQYHVVNSLGWPSLRPLQEQAIAPLLAGHHALLLAPTAGGKTEAALLPILSRMLNEQWRGPSVLYVCPIKALLNNLEARLAFLAGLVGRSVAVWHGDIVQGDKSRAERDRPDILLTTPESVEGMLLGSRRDHNRLLGNIRCVIADELHAFAADDRGWHLLALLERIRVLGAPLGQRIGLSATVGKPQALLDWFAGHSGGPTSLIQVAAPPAEVDLSVDYVGSIDNAAIIISHLHQGEKRLVFCDSRSKVEQLAAALRGRDVDVFVSHAALSADLRKQAEQAFAERQNCVIVATSTLELGLDVGDLDRVIQIDAPASVASFLQRLGRTGRRAGSQRNTLFLATEDNSLLEALAITRLFRKGYVEPVVPPPLPCHLLVQQLFALLMQNGRELEEVTFLETLGRIPGMATAIEYAWTDIRAHLLENGYLMTSGSFLGLGPAAETRFRGKGLADLCVSFDAPQSIAAMHGKVLIGFIDPLNLATRTEGPRVISLGGKAWRVVHVDRHRGRAHVAPAQASGYSYWFSPTRGASRVISQEARSILDSTSDEMGAALSRRATNHLADLRDRMQDTLLVRPVAQGPQDRYVWWTWQGLAANLLLAGRVVTAGGTHGAITAWSLTFNVSESRLADAGGWEGLLELQPTWKPATKPKFADLLPEGIVHDMTLRRISQKAGQSACTQPTVQQRHNTHGSEPV